MSKKNSFGLGDLLGLYSRNPRPLSEDRDNDYRNSDEKECPDCGGTGYDPYDGGQCDRCAGTGTIPKNSF